jgi:thiamine biosynthesis protein ThiS
LRIRLNGEPVDVPGPMTVSALLARYDLDARRVAVERNLVVVKRVAYDDTVVDEGDEVEVVNFVGGG